MHVSSKILEGDDYEIQFSVTDTGIGIPENKKDQLFLSFSQVDTSTTRKYGGTGLGLVISKRLAELMGGKIWVESEVGKGSIFHFTIIAKAATEKDIVFRIKDQQSMIVPLYDLSHPLRILLAEENEVNQKVVLKMLEKIGYQADVATNGLEVLKALQIKQFSKSSIDISFDDMPSFFRQMIRRIFRLFNFMS